MLNVLNCNRVFPILAIATLAACGGGNSNYSPPSNTMVPTISAQPANITLVSGNTATFMVTAASAAPLTYQWRKSGTAITGATGSSYTTPAESVSDSGATFDVVV